MGTSVGLYFMLFFSPGCFVLVSLIIAAMAAALCEVEQLTLAEASQKEKEFNQIVKVLKKREEEEVKMLSWLSLCKRFISFMITVNNYKQSNFIFFSVFTV